MVVVDRRWARDHFFFLKHAIDGAGWAFRRGLQLSDFLEYRVRSLPSNKGTTISWLVGDHLSRFSCSRSCARGSCQLS